MEKQRKLKLAEKVLLGKINYFEQSNHPVPTQIWFAEQMEMSTGGLNKMVTRLKADGYLEEGHRLKLTGKKW